MIRTDRFRISDRPYAVNLDSLDIGDEQFRSIRVDAVWFRRRRGVTVACGGYLWGFQRPAPGCAREFLAAHSDGRYGGDALARWDGSNLWAPQMPRDQQDRFYELLRPMLDAFPAIPDGFDGWWTFREAA